MDPQQRLLLEAGYEALHGGGKQKPSLLGSSGGVWVGIERPDWALLQASAAAPHQSAYAVTGDSQSVAGGRLSFALGLHGPCVSVDTACSSALVAVHGAWAALHLGECGEASASAVSLKLSPLPMLVMASAGMLAEDGRCKTWDAKANGYVRSEGVGSTALAVGDGGDILVGGVVVWQDGRSASLAAPNGSAQLALLGAALAAVAVGSIEAHGTGTALGDPTEAGALAAAMAAKVAVGAAKGSIGHSEAVSGQAGFLRALVGLKWQSAAGNAQLR
jgi:acyl transferase domain-containing protein